MLRPLLAALGLDVLTRASEAGASRRAGGARVITVARPFIDPHFAEATLMRLAELGDAEEVVIVLHTDGGVATPCVQIGKALRRFQRSTAVIPVRASSGGTVIALGAKEIHLGEGACLGPVDPQIGGKRARHLEDNPFAQEYETAIRGYVEEQIGRRVAASLAEPLVDLFMGKDCPHAWPIDRAALDRLGFPVARADRRWLRYVRALRLPAMAFVEPSYTAAAKAATRRKPKPKEKRRR